MKLISACLLGIRCTWSGHNKYKNDRAIELSRVETLIPVCPEQLGGLATPRAPQEIQGGTGEDVLDGKCKVLNKNRENVTKEFIGKSKSPSCGCGQIYDGTFSSRLIDADGVTTALLRRNGIRITPEEDL